MTLYPTEIIGFCDQAIRAREAIAESQRSFEAAMNALSAMRVCNSDYSPEELRAWALDGCPDDDGVPQAVWLGEAA